ncbi:hypothetical protein [Pseudooctadecabacter sp.]|uniref:hypothetical protein n=1 Tax=Pseudooctadecabacter sp. TaxID=1966338 RepID=UPI0035C82AC7
MGQIDFAIQIKVADAAVEDETVVGIVDPTTKRQQVDIAAACRQIGIAAAVSEVIHFLCGGHGTSSD